MWMDALIEELITILACTGLTLVITLFVAGAVLPRRRIQVVAVLVFSMAVIGSVAGLAGGMSRVGVVGDIIPAALTFVGAASVYLFGIKVSRGLFASFAAASCALSLGLGYAAGAGKRTQADGFQSTLDFCQQIFGSTEHIADETAFLTQAEIFSDHCLAVFAADFARTAEPLSGEARFGRQEVQRQYERQLKENMARAVTSAAELVINDIGQ